MSIEHGNQNEKNAEWKAPKLKGKSLGRKILDTLKSPVLHGTVAVGTMLSPEAKAVDLYKVNNTIDSVSTAADRVMGRRNESKRDDQWHKEKMDAQEKQAKAEQARIEADKERDKLQGKADARQNKAIILETMGRHGIEDADLEEQPDGKLKIKINKTGPSVNARDQIAIDDAKRAEDAQKKLENLKRLGITK